MKRLWNEYGSPDGSDADILKFIEVCDQAASTIVHTAAKYGLDMHDCSLWAEGSVHTEFSVWILSNAVRIRKEKNNG